MLFLLSAWACGVCAQDPNTLTAEEKQAGWRLLFDGRTTTGWRGCKSTMTPASWRVENGSLLARGNHVEHWMNGEKLLEYDVGSRRWQAYVKTSKFFPAAYGQSSWGKLPKGHVGLQDYGGAIEFRGIRIRAIDRVGPPS